MSRITTRVKWCPGCNGTGKRWRDSNSRVRCPRCRGTGSIEQQVKEVPYYGR